MVTKDRAFLVVAPSPLGHAWHLPYLVKRQANTFLFTHAFNWGVMLLMFLESASSLRANFWGFSDCQMCKAVFMLWFGFVSLLIFNIFSAVLCVLSCFVL